MVIFSFQECACRAGIEVGDYNSVRQWGLIEGRFTELVDAAAAVDADLFAPDPGIKVLRY